MGIFSFLGDEAQAAGDFLEAGAYDKGAAYAKTNAVLSQEAGNIKLAQTKRQIFQTLGQEQAGYASAGFRMSGSAGDVYRSSIQQGALERGLVTTQTAINVTGYQEQASMFLGMAAAANAAGAGAAASGIGQLFNPLSS